MNRKGKSNGQGWWTKNPFSNEHKALKRLLNNGNNLFKKFLNKETLNRDKDSILRFGKSSSGIAKANILKYFQSRSFFRICHLYAFPIENFSVRQDWEFGCKNIFSAAKSPIKEDSETLKESTDHRNSN